MFFGTSESAVRLLSVPFGILAIVMIYVLGSQLFDKEVGLVGALILALSSFNIWYSQEARMYSLMVLLTLLSMYFFLRFLQHTTLASSAGYVLSTTLLVYTHYYGLFVVIAQNIYIGTLLLLSKRRTHQLKHWVALQAIVLALFAPWTIILVKQFSRSGAVGFQSPATIATILDTFTRYSGTTVLLALFLGLSVLSLFAYRKLRGAMDWKAPLNALESYSWEVHLQDPAAVYFLCVWLIALSVLPLIISRYFISIYYYWRTIAASVALFLLAAKGIRTINYRPTKLAVIGIIVVLSVANIQVYFTSITRPQVREATDFTDANAKSGDLVLIYPAWQPYTFDYYNNRTDLAAKQIYSPITSSANSREALTKELQSDVTGYDRVWFFVISPTDVNSTLNTASFVISPSNMNFTLNVLNESYTNVYVKSYYGYNVYLFEKR